MAIVTFRNYKSGQTRACMSAVMRYVKRDDKVAWEGLRLVTGINCRPDTVREDFTRTKQLYHKEGGVLFYHMVQSFPKGADVDPKTAYAAAVELAGYFKDHEMLVCTHTDRDHIHSHVLINSVSFETGKKLHMADEQLQELRRRNDMVCEQFRLPVFERERQEKKTKPMTIGEYHVAAKGQSWKFRLMAAIDECMEYAKTREEFIALMRSEGYGVRWTDTRKYITYKTPDGDRCRDNKLHEEKYTKENMENEFKIRQDIIDRRAESPERQRPDEGKRVRDARHADREELVGGGESAGQDVFDAGYDSDDARCAADKAGRGRTARADRALDADAAPAAASDGGAVRAAGEFDERAVRREVERPASELGGGSPEAGKLDEEYAARYDERDTLADQRPDRIGSKMADAPRDHVAPAAGGAGDGLRDRHAAEAGVSATGWEKEREAFLKYLESTRLTRKTGLSLRAFGQGVETLLYAGQILDDDPEDAEELRRRIEAEETAQNLGTLIGIAAGVALGIAERRKEAEQVQQPMQQSM